MSYLSDLPGQDAYNGGSLVQPTRRGWNFGNGLNATYNAATDRIDITAGGTVYTGATLPATATTGDIALYTDHAWGLIAATFDGTNWRREVDNCIAPAATTDGAYLQELIDSQGATNERFRVIKLPPFDFNISAPLVLDQILGLAIICEGAVHPDRDSTHFCRIRLSDKNEAAVIIQGCDGILFRGLWVEGQNDINVNFAADPANLALLANNSNFLYDNPRTNRYSPHAGFVVDPLGSVPTEADRYPSLTADYGETSTSGVITWENCVVRSFVAGWLITPCTDLQLGDKMVLRDCHSRDNRDGFNSCQSQNKIHELINFKGLYQQFLTTTARYGNQEGCPPNIYGGTCELTKYIILWNSQQTVGNITNLYVESTLGLGFWGAGDASTARPLNWIGCTLKTYQQATSDQIEIDLHLQSHGIVRFSGCFIAHNSLDGVLRIHSNNPTLFDGCVFGNDSPGGMSVPVVMSQYAGNEVQVNASQARVAGTASHHYGYWTNTGSKATSVTITAGADYTATFTQGAAGDFLVGDVVEAVSDFVPEQATDFGFAGSTALSGTSCPAAVVTGVAGLSVTLGNCAESFHSNLGGAAISVTRRRYAITASGTT